MQTHLMGNQKLLPSSTYHNIFILFGKKLFQHIPVKNVFSVWYTMCEFLHAFKNQFLHQFYLSPENTHKTITNSAMLFGS